MSFRLPTLGIVGLLLGTACTSTPLEEDADSGRQPPANQTPVGDFTTIYDSPVSRSATALAFHPTRDELWVTLREFPSGQPCTQSVRTGCAALEGRVVVIEGAGSDQPSATLKKDDNAWHFMRRPSSLAFGVDGLFATCGESRTANFEDDPTPFTGPVLWSSDPEIFGQPQEGAQNGKHLDMLHQTPFCMGIAHERDNVYWAFNGDAGALDRYDFNEPHEIGGSDHADGELLRYADGRLSRVPEVPSHMAYDAANDRLYVADTGNARIVRLDPSVGTIGSEIPPYEGMQLSAYMNGAVLEELVTTGLTAPSGLTLVGDELVVTDNATSVISVFDLEGRLLRSYDTGLPTGTLGGIAVDAAGVTYVSDLLTGDVHRLDNMERFSR